MKKILFCLRSILFSTLFSLCFFLAFNIFITAVFNGGKYAGERNQIPYYIFLQLFYFLSFYLVHTRRQSKNEAKPLVSSFSLKDTALAYLKDEGKYFLWIYAVFAVLLEIVLLIGISRVNEIPVLSAISFVGELIFPFVYVLRVPVIRTLFTYALVAFSTVAIHALERYRLFNYWNSPSRNQ